MFDPEEALKEEKKKPSVVDYITATYKGFYYKSTGRGNEKTSFEESVKVPVRLVKDPNRSAIGIFRELIGPKHMQDHDGFSGFHHIQLVKCDKLPPGLPLYKRIDWTGTIKELTQLAKDHTPAVKAGLYFTPSKLKHAIRLCLQDEKAFIDLQDKQSGHLQEDHLIAQELEALGYN